jgi:voltage-gated potassium channel Kch
LLVGEITNVNEAIYFSLVTFTTLGYGELTLSESWRVMSAFEATNGVTMFGWTTALIIAVEQLVFLVTERDSDSGSESS